MCMELQYQIIVPVNPDSEVLLYTIGKATGGRHKDVSKTPNQQPHTSKETGPDIMKTSHRTATTSGQREEIPLTDINITKGT